ncbi:MAG: 30S ribosomal protein S12 methylthiotransferase RimO [Armatimonadetes bacterium]|nr:30S ribosomal protein S12 methylthiotransferase RimO [Armatimonadota bacterium]
MTATAKTRIGLISLGCPKNLVDSEEMLGALMASGNTELVDADSPDADVLMVNTCAFIESAKQESIEAILAAIRKKTHGTVKKVVVTGCLAQRYGDELAIELPEVDAFLGIQSAPMVSDVLFGTASARRAASPAFSLPMATTNARNFVQPLTEKYPLIPPSRIRATAPWTAYLKVSEGCDHVCTFCSIPSFRGRHRSKPVEAITEEARRLVGAGASEINLIAQDTTAYGMDLYQELALPRLLTELGKVEGLRWVRLLYCYPTMVTERLIKTMADTPNVAHYLDVPLQHGDDGMLKRMKRGGSQSSYLRMLERLRTAMPDVAVRTTFLVGFPGETDCAFENLVRFVQEARFDRLGVFTYSPEENTPGYEMTPVVPKKQAKTRRDVLMQAQQPISLAANDRLVNSEMSVLIEGRAANGTLLARSWRDAPEIDGTVRIVNAPDSATPGDWMDVRVVSAEFYDVTATPL